ncbi:hypothetical protein [Paraburkholderia terrae]|uniref:hypothetical protein n=1 Tax=Paraburkholderia terrae TaxID=311230 RepID=UPI001EE1A3C4|nr:hypothetical protein [Paraburkholderia terrae]GJH04646.1 hypothetical protein CBA19C8_28835 [Paraburkholderia terrae]
MDLREIQALHAQYTAQPVIIDIASHTAAMPALPAPDAGPSARVRVLHLAGGLRKAGKPALIALAIAALAAGGGMSVARIWRAMHETVVAPTAAVASAAKQAPAPIPASGPQGEMPIDVNPARPLTASDFDTHRPVAQSALANVDARSLEAASSNAAVAQAVPASRPAADNMAAAASPIRAPRQSPQVAPATAVATPSPAATTTPPATGEPQRTQPAQPAAAASSTAPVRSAATTTPETPKPEQRPALRPLHRVTHHATAATGSDTAPESTAPAQPKAQPARSGDVQLF